MDAKITEGWALVNANTEKIEELRKENTKIAKLAIHMLKGNPVSGRTMIEKFNIYSYRDAIYTLGQKGFNVSRKVVRANNGVEHVVWWLSEFAEEFVKMRDNTIF